MRDIRVLVIADTHAGSLAAPTPPRCTVIDPMTRQELDYESTKYQEALNECWNAMLDEIGRVDLVIANGDLADGVQPKSDGLSCYTTDKLCQAKNAAKLLATIRCDKFRISQGSPYHVGENACIDELVAEQLKEFKPDVGFKPSFIERLKDRDIRMHVMHKVGTSMSTWQYLCYSEDTQVLTRSGWKTHTECHPGEEIATYDPTVEKLMFESPYSLFNKPYEGPMVGFSNQKGSDVLVTPNHRMWVSGSGGRYGFRFAEDLVGKRSDTLITAPFLPEEGPDHIEMRRKCRSTPKVVPIDDWSEFLGYYLSEGGNNCSKGVHQIYLSQKEGPDARRIEQSVKKLKMSYHKYQPNKDGVVRWTFGYTSLWETLAPCGHLSQEKRIPREVFSYPMGALRRLFDAMMLGDGSADMDAYYTTSWQLANDFQELATRLGYPARIAVHYQPGKVSEIHGRMVETKQVGYRVYLKSYPTASLGANTMNYKGNVVCFSTRTGLYLTRRPGCYPAIQGNTTPLARDLVLLKLNDSVRKYGKVQLCIRSHAHIYVEAGYSSTRGIVSPAWQGPTPFMISHGVITPPEIGYVIVTIEPDGYLHVRPHVFPLQMPLGVFDD